MKWLWFTFLLGLFIPSFSQKNDLSLSQQLNQFTSSYPQEKVYVVTDRDTYVAGENIWFAVHLVDAQSHRPIQLSKIVYVDIVNIETGKVVQTRNIEIKDGLGKGDFELDYEILDGEYELVAYTNFMRNLGEDYFFRKTVDIISNQKEKSANEKLKVKHFQVQFFPEGGDLVDGLENLVAVKVVDSNAKLKSTNLVVYNSANEKIGTVQTNEYGMGVFLLLPEASQTYYALIDGSNKKFKLPQVLEEGYGLGVSFVRKNLIVSLQKSTKSKALKNHEVIGQIRGNAVFSKTIDGQNKFVIPTENLPTGVLHITHFDEGGRPQNERLVFIDNDLSKVDVTIESDDFSTERLSNQNVKVKVASGETDLDGNYSLTIVDDKFSHQNFTIKEYLLLDSDLKGKIPALHEYFDETLPKKYREGLLDLLMRTHGWRRFTWSDVKQESPIKITYLPEVDGFNFSYLVHQPENDSKALEANLRLSVFNPFVNETIKSNQDGIVKFLGLDLPDTTALYLKANFGDSYKIKKNNKIKPVEDFIQITDLNEKPKKFAFDNIKMSINEEEKQNIEEVIFSDIRIGQNFFNVFLDPVVVSARAPRKDERFRNKGAFYSSPSNRVLAEDYPTNFPFLDMLRRVPGISISGNSYAPLITIRGRGTINNESNPLVLLDGMPVDAGTMSGFTSFDIDFIDVLKGARASVYGARGSNGVIAVYTKRGGGQSSNTDQKYGKLVDNVPGYYHAREYYNPMFVEDEEKRMIYAPTLYWQADLKDGEIEFKNPDYAADYIIKVEGVTKTGIPVYDVIEFTVE